MKRTKNKDLDIAALFTEKMVALVIEFCVDCDTKKFKPKYWKAFKRQVELAVKVRNSRSIIEG